MDMIEIKRLKIFAYHGVLDEEREQGQDFYISAKLYLDLRQASMADDLKATVNYDVAAHTIEKVVTQEKWNLIEAVAESVASELLLQYQELRSVEVRVDKPEAPIELSFETVSVTIKRGRHRAYLSIGSNLGNRKSYLDHAVEQMGKDPYIRVLKSAEYIETEPYGPVEQPDFLNGAVEIETLYTPRELLQVLQDNATAKRTYVPYNQPWNALSSEMRRQGICHRCGSRENLHVHHIIPVREGGKREQRNLVVLCSSCHKVVEHQQKILHEIIPDWDIIQLLVRERLHCL